MKRIAIYIITLIILPLSSFSQGNKVVFKDCSAQEFLLKLNEFDNHIVLDTRTEKKYKRNRIKGALLAENFNDAKKILSGKAKNTPIFIYCETGDNSISIAALLMRHGYTQIYHLKNGLDDWWRAGDKLDKTRIKNIAEILYNT